LDARSDTRRTVLRRHPADPPAAAQHHCTSSSYRLADRSCRIITDIRATETAKIALFAARATPAEIAAFHKVQSALNQEFVVNTIECPRE
jgi:hypothetical protein